MTESILDRISKEVEHFDELLRPEADREVDINDPDWQEKLKNAPAGIDTLNIRKSVEKLTEEIIALYLDTNSETRSKIRNLVRIHYGFSYSMAPQFSEVPEMNFKQHLALLLIHDLGADTRDAIVWLDSLIAEAKESKTNYRPIMKEMYSIAGTNDRHGMGSVRSLMKKYC